MMTRKLTLLLGLALILVANGVALTGVAYNRSGEPESRLRLSQRELGRPWAGYRQRENSGIALALAWRVASREADIDRTYYDYGSYGGSPPWLDEKRMAELGFDVERVKGDFLRRRKFIDQSEREVFVVLELAGSAWQQAMERARQRVAHQAALRIASPQAKELVEAENRAKSALDREATEHSRLFAVDVGTDLASLRLKYPDRARHLILKGHVRMQTLLVDGKQVVAGYLEKLSMHEINVPHAMRGIFEAMPPRTGGPEAQAPTFTATIAVGRRLEPWIEAASAP